MAKVTKLTLKQGKLWEFTGTALDVDGAPVLWTDYGVRGKARADYTDELAAWDWVLTTGVAGEYTGKLGAVASALVEPGVYVSDIELYALSNADAVYEIVRMAITVVPEATK